MAFQKGQSGNPGGRANDKSQWRDALNIAVKRNYTDTRALAEDSQAPMLAVIAAQCVLDAAGGDMSATKEIGDRLDGKPPTMILGPGEDGSHKIQGFDRVITRPSKDTNG